MMRRSPLALAPLCGLALAALLLGGCERATRAVGVTGTLPVPEPQLIGPERLSVAIPGAGARATLGPVSRRGGVTVWQTLDGVTLGLRGGSLIATRGLGDDLMSADVAGRLEMLRGAGAPGRGEVYPHIRSYLDGEDRTVFRSYQCRRTARTRTTLEIGGTSRPARRIEELCVSPADRFTNVYWLEPGGTVLRSRQWISPTLEYMETTRLPR